MKCTILKIPSNFFCVFLIIFSVSQLSADRVSLKSGKVIENVKTSIEKTAVKIKYENGKLEALAKSDIKSLKITAVEWKTKTPTTPGTTGPTAEQIALEAEEEKARVAIASERGDEFTPRAEEEMVSPWGNFALGLIPGYSGLYRTQSTWGAATFTVLESLTFLYAMDLQTAKKIESGYDRFGTGGLVYIGSNLLTVPSQASTGNAVIGFGLYSTTDTYGFEGGITGTEYVGVAPSTASKRSYEKQKQTAFGILGILLFTDAIASYFSADSWNEGTYAGDTSDNFVRPTKPSARLLRSAFLPGWGQVYGGNKVKGYSWMAGGLLLLANVVGSEIAVSDAKKDYVGDRQAGFSSLITSYTIPNYYSLPAETRQLQTLFLNSLLIDPDYQKLETAVNNRNQAWTMYGVFWLLNLADSYFFSGKNESSAITITPGFNYSPVMALGNQAKWESVLSLNISYNY